jgi:hypothetical protein
MRRNSCSCRSVPDVFAVPLFSAAPLMVHMRLEGSMEFQRPYNPTQSWAELVDMGVGFCKEASKPRRNSRKSRHLAILGLSRVTLRSKLRHMQLSVEKVLTPRESGATKD